VLVDHTEGGNFFLWFSHKNKTNALVVDKAWGSDVKFL